MLCSVTDSMQKYKQNDRYANRSKTSKTDTHKHLPPEYTHNIVIFRILSTLHHVILLYLYSYKVRRVLCP